MKYEIISSIEVSPEHFNIIILMDNIIISYFNLNFDGVNITYTPCFMNNQSKQVVAPNQQLYEIADKLIKEIYFYDDLTNKFKWKILYIFLLLIFFSTSIF